MLSRFVLFRLADLESIIIADDHRHQLGDLVMWDNAATMHKATPLPPAATEEDVRVMFRVTLKGRPTVLS